MSRQVFLQKICAHLSKGDDFLLSLFDIQREQALSLQCDISGIQESFCFRAISRARALSRFLIDEKGEVRTEALERVIEAMEKRGFVFSLKGTNDSLLTEHSLKILKHLRDKAILQRLKQFQIPLCHPFAEAFVLDALAEGPVKKLTEAHVRRAVLISSLTPLRQNVGSCFATAPAILIQREQYGLFLEDLFQLLTLGKLKRTFGGREYAVALSLSAGLGDLKRSFPLEGGSNPAYSPGLIAVSEFLGVCSEEEPFAHKVEKIERLILSHRKQNAGDLIRALLYEQIGISEEELEEAYQLEKKQLRGRYPSDFHKLEKIQRFKEQWRKCCALFNGFCESALLKAWEFTLACFSEVKMEFSRWNLYTSLGFSPEENQGLGAVIYQAIDAEIQSINQKIEEYQKEYEIAFDQVRSVELLLKNAGSESEARRHQAEYQSRAYHMRLCLEMRDEAHAKGTALTQFYNFLMKQYDEKFPEYFQEIYDPEMQDFQGELYEDIPAGFRLVYKHGRSDPSLWTVIYQKDQYIDALIDFFVSTESQILSACESKDLESLFLQITSRIVLHLRTDAFLESAFQRMAKAHGAPHVAAPLRDIRNIQKKPWSYISGGTMTTLLKTYYCRESEFSSESRWMENETELLIFFIDTLKHLPPFMTRSFEKEEWKGMLAASPSHAFILYPGLKGFKEGWQEEIFTYTWVRDQIFLPSHQFYANLKLNEAEQLFLLEEFLDRLPPSLSSLIRPSALSSAENLTIPDFRNRLLKALGQAQKNLSEEIDAFLFESLPVVSTKALPVLIPRLLSDKAPKALKLEEISSEFLLASQVKEIAKACYLQSQNSLLCSFDLHEWVERHARFIGLSAPSSLLVADTNWTQYFFGFVVNPGTLRLEFWRVDRTLSRGFPLNSWKHWLNGSDKKAWTLYTNPNEYKN